MRRPRQLGLRLRTWGGARNGAGRKPKVAGRPGVSHRRRPRLASRFPVHVTVRMHREVYSLRSGRSFRRLRSAFAAVNRRDGFRLCHYSVQGNHIHFIVEARDQRALSLGMQSLGVRIARSLNEMMGRRGRVLDDRYHARILRTPTEVTRAVHYVLSNRQHHAPTRLPGGFGDPYASLAAGAPVLPARTLLLAQAIGTALRSATDRRCDGS